MGRDHGVIDQEWTFFIFFDEVTDVIRDDVRAKFSILKIAFYAVDFETGIRVTARPSGELPEAIFVEPEFDRPFKAPFKLPFSGYACPITGVAQHVPKGDGRRIE